MTADVEGGLDPGPRGMEDGLTLDVRLCPERLVSFRDGSVPTSQPLDRT